MKPKLKALAVSLALAAISVSAAAAIQTGDGGKLVPRGSSGDLFSAGVAWDLGFPADPFPSGSAVSPATASADTVWTVSLLPSAYSSVAMFSARAPGGVSTAGGIDAITSVTSGTPAANIRARTNTRLSTKARTADVGSANGLPEARSSSEENFRSTAERQVSATTALSVPEPGKWAVLLAGLLGAGAIARRRMPS